MCSRHQSANGADSAPIGGMVQLLHARCGSEHGPMLPCPADAFPALADFTVQLAADDASRPWDDDGATHTHFGAPDDDLPGLACDDCAD